MNAGFFKTGSTLASEAILLAARVRGLNLRHRKVHFIRGRFRRQLGELAQTQEQAQGARVVLTFRDPVDTYLSYLVHQSRKSNRPINANTDLLDVISPHSFSKFCRQFVRYHEGLWSEIDELEVADGVVYLRYSNFSLNKLEAVRFLLPTTPATDQTELALRLDEELAVDKMRQRVGQPAGVRGSWIYRTAGPDDPTFFAFGGAGRADQSLPRSQVNEMREEFIEVLSVLPERIRDVAKSEVALQGPELDA